MKLQFLDLLMQIFEQSLLGERDGASSIDALPTDLPPPPYSHHLTALTPPNADSIRVFTPPEHHRFTKPGYQFLLRMHKLGIINDVEREEVMNQLLFSHSRYITQDEVKWVIRFVLAPTLDDKALAFLDLVLYQQEDEITKH